MFTLFPTGPVPRMLSYHLLLGALLLSACIVSQAATQGNAGPLSSGSVNISLTIGNHVNISGLSDISLRSVDAGRADGSTSACLFASNGNLRINALGSGPQGEFLLASTDRSLSFEVQMEDAAGLSTLYPGVALTRATQFAEPHCQQAGPNARFHITTRLNDSAATVYSGSLTLMVTAE